MGSLVGSRHPLSLGVTFGSRPRVGGSNPVNTWFLEFCFFTAAGLTAALSMTFQRVRHGDDVIVIPDDEADTHATHVVAATRSMQSGGRAESARSPARGSRVVSSPTFDIATRTIRSRPHVRFADGLSSASTQAGSTIGNVCGNVGTHLQTAADLLAASPLAATAGIVPAPVRGMPLAKAPLELPYPTAPSSSSLLAAEVDLVVDDRETAGAGPSHASFLARLRVHPGLADHAVQRRLPVGDALLVARVTAAGAAAYEGAPPEGT